MRKCLLCGNEFKLRVVIDGKLRNLGGRKYCLECSPFKEGKYIKIREAKPRKCYNCGETDESKFYGHKRRICGKCQNQYVIEQCRKKKLYVLDLLGGKCVSCGFDKYLPSLDVHHTEPSKKDKNFRKHKGWNIERIKKEMENCVLLCRNCHAAFHAGLIVDTWSVLN